jgi:hypothetical protein
MDYTNLNNPLGSAPDNSAPTEKKIAPVVSKDDVDVKPAGLGKKLYSVFFSATPDEVARDVKTRVIVPALKRLLLEAITTGASMFINGNNQSYNPWFGSPYYGGYYGYTGGVIDYNRISKTQTASSMPASTARPLGIFSLDEVRFTGPQAFGNAERVRVEMLNHWKHYHVVSVSDYYDFCNWDHDWQCQYWGWDDLSCLEQPSSIVARGDGYILLLPKVRPLNKS